LRREYLWRLDVEETAEVLENFLLKENVEEEHSNTL